MKTKFFVMHEGRLVFEGTRARAAGAPIRTSRSSAKRDLLKPMPSQRKSSWAQLRVGLMAIVALVILGVSGFLLPARTGCSRAQSNL